MMKITWKIRTICVYEIKKLILLTPLYYKMGQKRCFFIPRPVTSYNIEIINHNLTHELAILEIQLMALRLLIMLCPEQSIKVSCIFVKYTLVF